MPSCFPTIPSRVSGLSSLVASPKSDILGTNILDIRSSSYSPFASVLMGDPEDLAVENFVASEYDHCLLRKLYVAEMLNRSYEHILHGCCSTKGSVCTSSLWRLIMRMEA
jgi:hypothetical protein